MLSHDKSQDVNGDFLSTVTFFYGGNSIIVAALRKAS
jgi:hypothetical protein